MESYANLTIFKQETPGISALTKATVLTDKLRKVSRVARGNDLRAKDYHPFVYEVLDTIPENGVSLWIVKQSQI